MYGWRTSLRYDHDPDHIMDHLSPAPLDPPFSTPKPSCCSQFENWDSMPLYMDLQEDYKIRDMNRVALLERNYCSSFFCCDIRLTGFHELLEHIEAVHFVVTNDKNGNKRYLYEPVGVSNAGQLFSPHQHQNQHQQQQAEENQCLPFDAGWEYELDTNPSGFWGYQNESQPSSPSPSPSPTISSPSPSPSSTCSSASSSPTTSPLLLPTRAPTSSLSTVVPTSHDSSPSPSPSSPAASIPLIAPIPSTPINYDLVVREGNHYSHASKKPSSTAKPRWKHASGTATATITAAAGTGFRKRGLSAGDREKLYRCPTVGCTKSYLNPNGLKYHREKGKCSFEEDRVPR
ncbi:hypothetical protein E1B28_002737 [Marasmius oreades]|uniref:C2H2-type domain-containing protein n=1 Tax=Marasmius oreades TaxID=181124 RepID=A0A9P7RNG7_9AGAR|nr:uncharacterized protein E1B28_002737 [Marasmius oreades]KAG7086814.1 hypothetical protein E1B28_002737 [Marasmius oreades]